MRRDILCLEHLHVHGKYTYLYSTDCRLRKLHAKTRWGFLKFIEKKKQFLIKNRLTRSAPRGSLLGMQMKPGPQFYAACLVAKLLGVIISRVTFSIYSATNVPSTNRYRMGPAYTLFKTNVRTDIIWSAILHVAGERPAERRS